MKDNVLKKEFAKKDVKRLRNLVKGKSGERTGQGVGYTKKDEFHKEGDTWEENGRMWTIKDGIKENITKLDKFKKAAVPLFCPSCSRVMNRQLDPHYYKAYGKCIDCRAKFETKLKIEGANDAVGFITTLAKKIKDGTIDITKVKESKLMLELREREYYKKPSQLKKERNAKARLRKKNLNN